jgi:hypothetical protein
VVVVVQQKLTMISYSQPPPKPWMMDPLSKINELEAENVELKAEYVQLRKEGITEAKEFCLLNFKARITANMTALAPLYAAAMPTPPQVIFTFDGT